MRRNHYCNAMLLSNPVLGGLSYSPVVEKKRGVERGEWREGVSGACPQLVDGSRESSIGSGLTRNLGWILVDRRHNKELANRKLPASCHFHYSPLATSHFPLASTSTNKLGASTIDDSRFTIPNSRAHQFTVTPPFIINGIELYPQTSKNFLSVKFCTSTNNLMFFPNLYSA